MTLYLSNRDGNGKTSEEGHYRLQTKILTGDVLGAGSLSVVQNSPAGMSVLISVGDFKIDTTDYSYTAWNSTPLQVNIPTADPANPRISTIVLYVDRSASTSPSPPNNPGIVKAMQVSGSPAAIPVAPSSGAIQTAVGANNPYIILADVRTNAGATSIVNANITDRRTRLYVGNEMVQTSSLKDASITTVKLVDSSVTTPKVNNGAITTAKFKPTIINSNFTKASSRYNQTVTGWQPIPNCSMTYTAGPTPERLILTTGAMANKSTSGNGEIALYVNGAAYGIRAYYNSGVAWYRSAFTNVLDLTAGQTVTLAVWAYSNDTAGFSITNEQDYWKPGIHGFSVYNGA